MKISNIKINGNRNFIGYDNEDLCIHWNIINSYSDNINGILIISDNEKDIINNIGNIITITDLNVKKEKINLKVHLKSRTRYYIKIFGILNSKESFQSEIVYFETSNFGEFTGSWIQIKNHIENKNRMFNKNPTNVFYKKFNIEKYVEKSRIYISGLGYYDCKINNMKITNSILNPSISNYNQISYYDCYDVTKLLKKGENIIEVEIGNGMYDISDFVLFGKYDIRNIFETGHNKMIVDLENYYKDGSSSFVCSDATWKAKKTGRLRNDIYLGEMYDFTYKNNEELNVKVVNGPKKLVSTKFPRIETIKNITKYNIIDYDKIKIIEFEKNSNAQIELQIKGTKNQCIKLSYGEVINEDGLVNLKSTKPGGIDGFYNVDSSDVINQADEIKCSGQVDKFENKFSFHSYRYVQLESDKNFEIVDVSLKCIATNFDITGTFKSSDEDIMKLYEGALQTKYSNVYSIYADTPRERLGYGGDVVCTAKSNMYIFDTYNFQKKIIKDFIINQDENGGFTETAPFSGIKTKGLGGKSGPIGWQFVVVYLIMKNYQFYGDINILKESFPAIEKQLDFLNSLSFEYIKSRGLGDWCAFGRTGDNQKNNTDNSFTSMVFLLLHFEYGEKISKILDYGESVKKYKNTATQIRKYIEEEFMNENGTFHENSHTSYAFSIYCKLGDYDKNAQRYISKIKEDKMIFTGIFGTMMTYEILNAYDENELVFKFLTNRERESFLNMIELGGGSLWESHDALKSDDVGSLNHSMFTSYVQWFYEALGGIIIDEHSYGFDKVTLKPYFCKDINDIEVEVKTVKGTIKSKWYFEKEFIYWEVDIPQYVQCINGLYGKINNLSKDKFEKRIYSGKNKFKFKR